MLSEWPRAGRRAVVHCLVVRTTEHLRAGGNVVHIAGNQTTHVEPTNRTHSRMFNLKVDNETDLFSALWAPQKRPDLKRPYFEQFRASLDHLQWTSEIQMFGLT